jgi:G3E family GTPase
LTPLILVTGFLGSGKTTLIASLLQRRAARQASGQPSGRIGLLVNEVGAVGIDGDLLAGGVTSQIELAGGCVCCALSEDLAKSIVEMQDRNPDLDAIILETTGVAEPLPIAWAIERAPLSDRVRLATVVTLIDVENFATSRTISPSVDSQVAYADILIATKSQWVTPAQTADVKDVALAIAGRALWFDVSTEKAAQILDDLVTDPSLDRPPQHKHECSERCSHTDHGIDSVALHLPQQPVDVDDFEDAIRCIADTAIRIKGIVQLRDGSWIAFHRVGPRFSIEPLPAQPQSQQPRMVVLGTSLDPFALKRTLQPLYESIL